MLDSELNVAAIKNVYGFFVYKEEFKLNHKTKVKYACRLCNSEDKFTTIDKGVNSNLHDHMRALDRENYDNWKNIQANLKISTPSKRFHEVVFSPKIAGFFSPIGKRITDHNAQWIIYYCY